MITHLSEVLQSGHDIGANCLGILSQLESVLCPMLDTAHLFLYWRLDDTQLRNSFEAYAHKKILAKGGQKDSQVAKSRTFHSYHWLMRFYYNRLLAINLCRLVLGGQTVKSLRLLASKFELDQSQRKSTQVAAS